MDNSVIAIHRVSYRKNSNSAWLTMVFDDHGKETALAKLEGQICLETVTKEVKLKGKVLEIMRGDAGRFFTYYIKHPDLKTITETYHGLASTSHRDWYVHKDYQPPEIKQPEVPIWM